MCVRVPGERGDCVLVLLIVRTQRDQLGSSQPCQSPSVLARHSDALLHSQQSVTLHTYHLPLPTSQNQTKLTTQTLKYYDGLIQDKEAFNLTTLYEDF